MSPPDNPPVGGGAFRLSSGGSREEREQPADRTRSNPLASTQERKRRMEHL